MANWPLQRDCNKFYGDPTKAGFEAANIVRIVVPWKTFYGAIPISKVAVHKKCADAFEAWFDHVWINAGKNQKTINEWGMSSYGGGFIVRQKRAGSTLSMHSYGCALDFDAPRNGFGDQTPHFGTNKEAYRGVVVPFKALGGVWGGDWTKKDGMHFQFARVT